MSDERIDLTLDSSPLAQYLASIGLQDQVPTVELHLEDLPPIKPTDSLVSQQASNDTQLQPPWHTASDILKEIIPLLLNSGLIPSDELSLLQLGRVSRLKSSLSFTYQTPKVLAFAFSVIAFLACLFFRSLTAGLILAMTLGAYLALRKIQSRSAVKQRLVGRFEQLSKQEITRHEKLFIVLRRTHELEQLERGFRFNAPMIAQQSSLPNDCSPYLGVLQHTTHLALQQCIAELQCACAFISGTMEAEHRSLLPALNAPNDINAAEESAHALRQQAYYMCSLRAHWFHHLIALAATNPRLLLQCWSIISHPTKSIDELRFVLEVESYLEVLRKRTQEPPLQPRGLVRTLSVLRNQLRGMVALTATAEEAVTSRSGQVEARFARLREELAYAGALLVEAQTFLTPKAPPSVAVTTPREQSGPLPDAEVFEASGAAEIAALDEEDDEEEDDEERIARMTTVAREMAALLTGKPPPAAAATSAAAAATPTRPRREGVVVKVDRDETDKAEDNGPPPVPSTHLFAELRSVLTHRKNHATQAEEQFGND